MGAKKRARSVVASAGKRPAPAPKVATKAPRRPPGRKTGRTADPLPPPTTEGQRVLQSITAPRGDIAARVQVSDEAVRSWLRGTKQPDDRAKRLLAVYYGIPTLAWSTAAGGELVLPGDPTSSAPTGELPAISDDELSGQTLEQDFDGMLLRLRRRLARGDLTTRDHVQLSDALRKTAAAKQAFDRERELLEDRTIREHPKWKLLRKALFEALRPHKAAAQAVEAAINRLIGAELEGDTIDVEVDAPARLHAGVPSREVR